MAAAKRRKNRVSITDSYYGITRPSPLESMRSSGPDAPSRPIPQMDGQRGKRHVLTCSLGESLAEPY